MCVIVFDRYSHRKSFRSSQVYVGQALAPGRERVYYVAPKPEDVPDIMSAYDRMLESFSARLMRKIRYEMSEECEITVQGDSADWYRYIDFTFIAERFLKVVEQTIQYEWAAELTYLNSYDVTKKLMRQIVDMPDEDVNRMMRFVCQNNGKLGADKRAKFFSKLSDEQVLSFEGIIREHLMQGVPLRVRTFVK